MPLYEYLCADCHAKFETLRTMSQANEPIACRFCNSPNTTRVLSTFAAISRGGDGQTRTVAGVGSGCASCGSHQCSRCSHA